METNIKTAKYVHGYWRNKIEESASTKKKVEAEIVVGRIILIYTIIMFAAIYWKVTLTIAFTLLAIAAVRHYLKNRDPKTNLIINRY